MAERAFEDLTMRPYCRFDTIGGSSPIEFRFTPYPEPGDPPNLARLRSDELRLLAEGTAADRASERIIAEPSWGSDAFVDAALVPAEPAEVEHIDAYVGHERIDLTVPTKRLLASHELIWLDRLAKGLVR